MHFKIAVSDPSHTHFSLDKAGADFSHNQIVLNSIVGTLVKYGPSGRLEPYLAESWTVSSDKKKWKFKIRPDLFSEDGTPITAALFKNILRDNLLEYSLRGSVIMFDHLLGWDRFQKGQSPELDGLTTYENIVELNFDENPDDLLELLRMPYFGMWREKEKKLISSGPYTIAKTEANKVRLKLRPDWFTATQDSFREVEISFTAIEQARELVSPSTITRVPFFVQNKVIPEDGYWISSPPTRLESFVLSPYKNHFFNNEENRQIFRSRVMALSADLVKSKFFYPAARTEGLVQSSVNYKKMIGQEKLTFALERSTYTPEEIQNLHKIITLALQDSGMEFEVISRDLNDKDWFKKTDSNDFFDARIASVDVGAYPIYTAIKMMFCTKLGINFPDHSGKICKLVNSGIKSAEAINQNFIDQFNNILHQDAVIIPIHHHSDKWLVAKNLDPNSLPATTLYPQFELIRLR